MKSLVLEEKGLKSPEVRRQVGDESFHSANTHEDVLMAVIRGVVSGPMRS